MIQLFGERFTNAILPRRPCNWALAFLHYDKVGNSGRYGALKVYCVGAYSRSMNVQAPFDIKTENESPILRLTYNCSQRRTKNPEYAFHL